jgi:hypothetical protein
MLPAVAATEASALAPLSPRQPSGYAINEDPMPGDWEFEFISLQRRFCCEPERRHPLTVATLGMQGQRLDQRDRRGLRKPAAVPYYSKTVALQIKRGGWQQTAPIQ